MSEQEIYIAAMNRPDPADRRRFLDEACAGNEVLRERIETLIRQSDQLGSFLEKSPQPEATADISIVAEKSGTQIGPYKLLQQIGEGGMGTVWMAQQTEPVKRLVAVKVIKPGMDSRQVIARFEAERQALALMDHANIARVLDAGTTSAGRPYFVMDLVRGVPITQYCDEHHLTPRQRLELFLPVCQAVQHAHQKGIIHRDLKPSNVLVALYDGQPVPKVIDFGVAKAAGQPLTEQTLVTGFGAIVGTLEYMSPEQAEVNQLDIDTRSDIYSLGVLLYELLTGSTPFDKHRLRSAAWDEMLRIIREEEPEKPSTRLSESRSRLPNGTSASGPIAASGSARQAEPTLASIAAVRGTEPAKLTKLVRGELDWIVMKALEKDRNRRYETANGFAADIQHYLNDEAVIACPPSVAYRFRKFARRNKGGLAVAALVLFFLVLIGSGAGWAWRDREAREAEAARRQAERQAKVAGQVESIFSELDKLERKQEWPEALAAARRAEAVVTGGEADAETQERVRRVLHDLQMVARLEELRLSEKYYASEPDDRGGWYLSAGDTNLYAAAFRDFGVDVETLPAEEAATRLRARPAVAVALAGALDDWARLVRRRAPDQSKRLWALAAGVDPDPWRAGVRRAAAAEDHNSLWKLANAPDTARQPPQSQLLLATQLHRFYHTEEAIALLERACEAHPGDFWIHYSLGAYNGNIRPQRLEAAVRHHTAARALRPGSAATWTNLGISLRDQKKLDEAIACHRKAIEIDPNYATAHESLGHALLDQNKPDEALRHFRKAIEIDPRRRRNLPGAINNQGVAMRKEGQVDQALAAYRIASEIDAKLVSAYVNLGCLMCDDLKEYGRAIEYFRKALELDPKNANAYGNLGAALANQGKLDEAIDAFRKAIELDGKNAKAHYSLGLTLSRQNKLDEAVASYRQGIELEPNSPQTLNNVAWILVTRPEASLRDPREAVALAKRAVELKPGGGTFWNTLGVAHYRADDWKAAIAALEKSMELRQGGDGDDWFFLAMAHWRLGEKEEAREWYDKAVEWMEANAKANAKLIRFRAEAEEMMKKEM